MNKKKPKTRYYNSQADRLVALITKGDYKLFRDQFDEACIVDSESPFIARRINTEEMKRYLSEIYWRTYRKSLRLDVLNSVIITLTGIALFSSDKRHVFTRVARDNDTIYYDLGDNIHVIRIDGTGWEISKKSPVYFRRYTHQLPQVVPRKKGSLSRLKKYLNVDDDAAEILLMTYLPVSIICDIERPLILMNGPQGSGKSTALEIIRSMIDPTLLPLLQPPRNDYQMVQQANKHYAYFIDNVSFISRETSDALCRLVTGCSFSKRALFTNDEDFIYKIKSAVGLTSIAQLATYADLLDRSLIIQLEIIEENKRRSNAELKEKFEIEKPYIFGGILNALSATLKSAPRIEFKKLPRLADYYRYAAGVAEYLGYGQTEFEEAYKQNKNLQDKEAIENSSVTQAILIYMKNKKSVKGTPTEMYLSLKNIADRYQLITGFPKSSVTLWRKIQEAKATLISIGIIPNKDRESSSRYIILKKSTDYNYSLDASLPGVDQRRISDYFGVEVHESDESELAYHARVNPKTRKVEIIRQETTYI